MRTVDFDGKEITLIDQNALPLELKYVKCRTPDEAITAIKRMTVRGAPAIGITGAAALALATNFTKDIDELRKIAAKIKSARPTAVNLEWGVDRILRVIEKYGPEAAKDEVLKMIEEDIATNKRIGEYGSTLVPQNAKIMTICNAGWLATAGEYGTATAVIKVAWEKGKNILVYACETRPKLQGARLTVWELMKDGIPVIGITDNMAGYVMAKRGIDLIVVGADRILADGTVYNKIGTYTLAILAKYHNIPFYVAAPYSTFDLKRKRDEVVIEERDPREVIYINGRPIMPPNAKVINPAFDETPPELVTAIITDRGIIRPPYKENIPKYMQ